MLKSAERSLDAEGFAQKAKHRILESRNHGFGESIHGCTESLSVGFRCSVQGLRTAEPSAWIAWPPARGRPLSTGPGQFSIPEAGALNRLPSN